MYCRHVQSGEPSVPSWATRPWATTSIAAGSDHGVEYGTAAQA
jgi:hypothetical protein